MNKATKRFYLAAKADTEFNQELEQNESEYKYLTTTTQNGGILIYCSMYLGWLIGKGRYNELEWRQNND